MESSVCIENVRENVNLLSTCLSQTELISHWAREKAFVHEWVNFVYCLWYIVFRNQSLVSIVYLGGGGVRSTPTKQTNGMNILSSWEGFLAFESWVMRWPKYSDFSIASYGNLSKHFSQPSTLSDPVFCTKPQVPHPFCPFRTQNRFWVAIYLLLLPGILLWSLWVLQERYK